MDPQDNNNPQTQTTPVPPPQEQPYYGPPPQQQYHAPHPQQPYDPNQPYAAPPPQQAHPQPYYGPPPQQQQYHAPHPQQQQPMYASPHPQQQGYPQQQQQYPQQQQQVMTTTMTTTTTPLSSSSSLIDQVFAPNAKVLVKQRIEPFELITGFETENKYDVHFANGYHAVAMEESSFMSRWCLGASRPFTMHIAFKENKQEFLTLERPWKFMFHEVNVLDTTNNRAFLGKVKLRCSFCTREMSVFDENNAMIYQVIAPVCSFWSFYIESPTGERLGQIKKKWSGLLQEWMTDADNFGVEFPPSATPKHKALLLAATFLIDFLYFEDNQNNNNRRRY